jgi:hypothetical protein
MLEVPGQFRAIFYMTIIASWVTLDDKVGAKEVSSIYIVSDSRISWPDGSCWDHARKVFNFTNHPDILGYSGDVLFPSQVLSQILSLGDAGLLFDKKDSFNMKSDAIFKAITRLFGDYPKSKLFPSFTIMHYGKQIGGDFGGRIYRWEKARGWAVPEPLPIPEHTQLCVCVGSGSAEFMIPFNRKHKPAYGPVTSKDIYQQFVETLCSIKNPSCGGPPQLAGVFRNDFSQSFGIISNEKRYVLGLEIENDANLLSVEWRNELFERCDPITKERFASAKRQPKV